MKAFTKTLLLAAAGCVSAPSLALPVLQLYVEGGTYDSNTETWEYVGTNPVRLWTIGDVGAVGTITDVKLSIAYADGLTPTFTLTSSTTAGYGGFTDPSTPIAAIFSKTVTDGSAPILGDGSSLPTHGIYGVGTDWTEYKLGDFSLMDSPLGDFMTNLPTADTNKMGQINVYQIVVSGAPEGSVFHFDLYDHYVSGNDSKLKYVNAPFSHDGEATSTTSSTTSGQTTSGQTSNGTTVPEPGMLSLLGIGLLGQALLLRQRRRRLEK